MKNIAIHILRANVEAASVRLEPNFADGSVGFVIGGFQFALGCVLGMGRWWKKDFG